VVHAHDLTVYPDFILTRWMHLNRSNPSLATGSRPEYLLAETSGNRKVASICEFDDQIPEDGGRVPFDIPEVGYPVGQAAILVWIPWRVIQVERRLCCRKCMRRNRPVHRNPGTEFAKGVSCKLHHG